MKITISDVLASKLPNFNIIAYRMDVVNQTTEVVNELLKNLKTKEQDVVNIPKIKETRDAYKTLGKDPSHTRCASEALYRRILKGVGLYKLGDIIDLGNILSFESRRSVFVGDNEKIDGDIYIRIGNSDESFQGISRGLINAHNLIVYTDALGIFGSPTSDTLRTCVDEKTKHILVMMMCFSEIDLEADEKLLVDLYKNYANATNLRKIPIIKEGINI